MGRRVLRETSWFCALIQTGLCILCAYSAVRRAGASFPQLCCGVISIFSDPAESNIKVPSNFNNFDIYIYICACILCLCIYGYICVCIARKKRKYGYVYTCVISYLVLKYRCLCGKQVVKLFIVQEFRKLGVLYSLIRFPMLGWSFHLKN